MASGLCDILERAVERGARLGAVVTEAGVERAARDADGLYPLASVRKVVTLGGYALSVAGGVSDPGEPVPVADVERWYWPGTDGGAHRRSRDWWASDTVVPLEAVAEAMIRFSDNAAADYLLDRVGPDGVDSFARRAGLAAQEPILPILGEFRAWHRSPDRWLALDAGQRAAEAWRHARSPATAAEDSPVEEATQRRCAAVGCRGTPRQWARLMVRLAGGIDVPAEATEVIRRVLEFGAVADDPVTGRLGRKDGDLPGVVAFAGYVRDRGGDQPEVGVALFVRDLPGQWQGRVARALPQSASELLALATSAVGGALRTESADS
ncbi:MAG TPA: serine hydrolase [Acidimicrobiia bacterium]|nr:serine hydrolase [Acidimicrobiia bacterium]